MNIDWNSDNYDKSFNFVYGYGEGVADLITEPKASLVCDLGCGTGALTKKLAERGYNVIGIDASEQMLNRAKEAYPELQFIQADALSFTLKEKADVIFSNAVFHWIDRCNQPVLLKNIAKNLKQGGRLVCEFGGYGCAQTVHNALKTCFERHNLTYHHPHYFPTIGEYAPLLEEAGLKVTYAALFDRPTRQVGEHGVADWINMFLPAVFKGVDESEKNAIIKEAEELTKPTLYTPSGWFVDYVRIRLTAVKV
ncbi:MAG: class I SAM-dependent methyltransferase [Candidatus Coproplasma sp.]